MLREQKKALVEELGHMIRGEIAKSSGSAISTKAIEDRIEALEKGMKGIKSTLNRVDHALGGSGQDTQTSAKVPREKAIKG